jgi:hypothetical protein
MAMAETDVGGSGAPVTGAAPAAPLQAVSTPDDIAAPAPRTPIRSADGPRRRAPLNKPAPPRINA